MKTPEKYFEDQVFAEVNRGEEQSFTPEEKSFLDRYLGGDGQRTLEDITTINQEKVHKDASSGPGEVKGKEEAGEEEVTCKENKDFSTKERTPAADKKDSPGSKDKDQSYREAEKVQMISFWLGGQEFALPVARVKEVIRYQEPTKLPASPEYIEGIVNLRGRVTPMLRLSGLIGNVQDSGQSKFIIVLRDEGLQIGLIIDSIAMMNHVPRENIEWGVESSLGADCDLVEGVIKGGKKLVAVLSVDKLSEKLVH